MHVIKWLQATDYLEQVWSENKKKKKAQKVATKGPFSLFSYPSNQHEWTDCLSALKLGQRIVFSFTGKWELEWGEMKAAGFSWQ